MNKMVVNGYNAEVLDHKHYVALIASGSLGKVVAVDLELGSLSPATVKRMQTRAVAEGYDRIEFVRSRYVSYSRRDIMRNMSGWVKQYTVYTLRDGLWVKSNQSKQELY